MKKLVQKGKPSTPTVIDNHIDNYTDDSDASNVIEIEEDFWGISEVQKTNNANVDNVNTNANVDNELKYFPSYDYKKFYRDGECGDKGITGTIILQ